MIDQKIVLKIQDYNSEPVLVCLKCFSLDIKYNEDLDVSWCRKCSSLMNLKKVHINRILKLQEMKSIVDKFKNGEL